MALAGALPKEQAAPECFVRGKPPRSGKNAGNSQTIFFIVIVLTRSLGGE